MLWLTGSGESNFVFNIVDSQTAPVSSTGGICTFSNVIAYEGTYLTAEFVVDTSNYNQKFTYLKNQRY